MNSKNRSVTKLILFVVGVIILIFGSLVIKKPMGEVTWKWVFMWISISMLYIGFSLPIIIPLSENSDRIFTGGAVYYKGFVVYAVISFSLLTIIKLVPIRLGLAMFLQCIAIFIFLVYIYLACFTAQHVTNVETIEEGKTAQIEILRESSKYLAIKAARLGDDKKEIKDMVNRLADNFCYLSPSENPIAIELETRMIEQMEAVTAENIFSGNVYCTDENVIKGLNEINDLYKQRKSIY